jgi:ATP-binding cassette, subfamily G (WHITE), member 2, PDR
MIFFMFTYLFATETIAVKRSKGEILLFRRSHRASAGTIHKDLEIFEKSERTFREDHSRKVTGVIQKQTAIFQWKDICFDIKVKKETLRLLDRVDGWVKPGTLTALMV